MVRKVVSIKTALCMDKVIRFRMEATSDEFMSAPGDALCM